MTTHEKVGLTLVLLGVNLTLFMPLNFDWWVPIGAVCFVAGYYWWKK